MATDIFNLLNRSQESRAGRHTASNLSAGMNLREKYDESSAKKTMKDLYTKNTVTAEDGSVKLNRAGFLSDLAKLDGKGALDKKAEFEAQDAQTASAKMKSQIEQATILSSLAGSASDQATYESALGQAGKLGLDVSQMPRQFDPNFVRSIQARALSAKDQLEQSLAGQRMALDKDKFGLDKNKHYADVDRNNKSLQLEYDKLGAGFNMQEARLAHEKAQKGMELSQREQESLRKHQEFIAKQSQAKSGQGKTNEMTVAEAKQLGLYKSGILANQQYEEAMAKGDYDPTSYMALIDNNSFAPQGLKSSSAQAAQAAEEAWVESFLRDASGAAIPATERAPYKDQFFARKGDSKDVLKNKAALRAQKMENARVGSGVEGVPQEMQAQSTQQFDPTVLNQMSDQDLMQIYKQMGGR
jgi:hypothetical protein